MGKILQILCIGIAVSVITARDYFYQHGMREDYPAYIGMAVAGVIFIFQRGALPLIGIAIMVLGLLVDDASVMHYRIDHDMVLAAGMAVAGYAWYNAYR